MAHVNALVQDGVVALVVGIAFVHATARLLPARHRKAFAGALASLAEAVGLSSPSVRRIEAKLASGGACGSCDTCNACAAPAAPTTGFRSIPIRRVDR